MSLCLAAILCGVYRPTCITGPSPVLGNLMLAGMVRFSQFGKVGVIPETRLEVSYSYKAVKWRQHDGKGVSTGSHKSSFSFMCALHGIFRYELVGDYSVNAWEVLHLRVLRYNLRLLS